MKRTALHTQCLEPNEANKPSTLTIIDEAINFSKEQWDEMKGLVESTERIKFVSSPTDPQPRQGSISYHGLDFVRVNSK